MLTSSGRTLTLSRPLLLSLLKLSQVTGSLSLPPLHVIKSIEWYYTAACDTARSLLQLTEMEPVKTQSNANFARSSPRAFPSPTSFMHALIPCNMIICDQVMLREKWLNLGIYIYNSWSELKFGNEVKYPGISNRLTGLLLLLTVLGIKKIIIIYVKIDIFFSNGFVCLLATTAGQSPPRLCGHPVLCHTH